MPRAKFLTIVLLILIIVLLIKLFPRADSLAPVPAMTLAPELTVKNKVIRLEFASTPAEQERGLSDRPNLAADQGLLFVYQTEVIPLFWMKAMNFPLDIIWLDKDKKIVGLERDVSPATYPATFHPLRPIRYVLEVNAGFAKKYHLEIGDKAAF